MSEWGEYDDVEIVDVDVGVDDIPDESGETVDGIGGGIQPQSEWGNLSDAEMQRRGEELGKRLELQSSLQDMRLEDLRNGAYDQNLLVSGESLDLDDETAIAQEKDIPAETNDDMEMTTPSDLDRLKALRDLVEERDPETCAILERMNENDDEEPPQKVLKLR